MEEWVAQTEIEESNPAPSREGSGFKKMKREERLWRQLLPRFPEWEDNETHDPKDEHSDDVSAFPTILRLGRDCKRDQNQGEGAGEEDYPANI